MTIVRGLAWVFGSLLWGMVFFFVGLYITFPQAPIQARAEYEFVEFTDKEFAITTESVRPWWIGLTGKDVTLFGLKKGKRTKDEPKPGYERRPLVTFDSLGIRAEPFTFVLGTRAARFAADLLGGVVEGRYAQGSAVVDVAFEGQGLDLAKLILSGPEQTLNLLGTLSGAADLHFDTEDVKQSSGTLRLEIAGFGLGAGSNAGGFGLPEASFDKAVLAMEVQDGKLEVTEGVFEGSVLTASLTGDIGLNKRLMRSRNHLDLAFTLPEEFDQLAQLAPTLKRSRDDEGRYHCSVSGSLLSPSFRCGSRTSRSRTDAASGTNVLDDEERRAQREKRIQERRDRLKAKREKGGVDERTTLDRRPLDPYEGDEIDGPPPGEMGLPMPPDPEFAPDRMPFDPSEMPPPEEPLEDL